MREIKKVKNLSR